MIQDQQILISTFVRLLSDVRIYNYQILRILIIYKIMSSNYLVMNKSYLSREQK